MLNMKSKVSMHQMAMKRSMQLVTKKPLTSMMTVLMLALMLVLTAVFWHASSALHQFTSKWQNNGHILMYLKVPTEPQDASRLLSQIQTIPGVASASLITPEQGLELLQQQESMQDILSFLPNNPLPFVVDVVPAMSIDTPAQLEALYQQLKAYSAVDEASLDLAWMQRLFAVFHCVSNMLTGINVLLALAVILITGNTLRLIIKDRADEMRVFKWVGAGDGFIMRPFLYLGVFYCFLAALFAWIFVGVLVFVLNQKLHQLLEAYSLDFHVSTLSVDQSLFLLTGASILGWIGARLSVRVILRETS